MAVQVGQTRDPAVRPSVVLPLPDAGGYAVGMTTVPVRPVVAPRVRTVCLPVVGR